jgi:dipeptidyl aminopeptidase/acylaminoacyl peptidase
MKSAKNKLLNAIVILLFLPIISMQAQDIKGTWKGKITVQGMEIPLVFHISEEEGKLKSTMDSPSQGATGIPMDKTSFENNALSIEFTQGGIKFLANLKDNSLTGTFYQSGLELPLVMGKSEKTLPGNALLPSSDKELEALASLDTKGNYKYKVEDYFARPKAATFRFSPNGMYMSYREKDEKGKNHIYVKHTETGKVTRVIEEKEELIRGYGWANDERLVYAMDQGGNENYHIYAANIDGSNQKDLTPFEGVKASILEMLKEDKEHIIVSLNKNNPQVFEPYKLNIITGELIQLFKNEDISNPVMGYNFDKDGNLRGYTRLRDGVNIDMYYAKEKDKFDIIKKLSWKDTFTIASFDYSTEYPHDAYVVSNMETDKAIILLYDLKTDKPIKKLFEQDNYDTGGMALSRKRGYELDYFSYQGVKQEIVPVSDYYKKLHTRITKEFPGYEYSIPDFTDDESKYLVFIQSDKLYGIYHMYDAEKDEFKLLYNLMPQLKEEDMAEMRPISFKSRDGITLHGYITLPKAAANGQKIPLIVNPHGGPQGVRDSWGFNPETQLFASRGYATLQVNFRISGGYGREFLESGFKQIGRKAMDDVEDGIAYAISQGWVDKDKVAIYGGSHGGYAVLRGMTKTPELYACGVDYVGVSNIFTFMKSIPPYWKPYLSIIKEIWYDEDIAAEKKIMEEVSPVYQIGKIKKPLFVVQGANDPRVNIDESDQIVSSLRAKGYDVPYMVRYDEGHGFAKEENSVAMYRAMMGFYAKHLGQPAVNLPLKK